MASRATVETWLAQITNIPTAPGREDGVIDWVKRWVSRRDNLVLKSDSGGNLLITRKGKKPRPLVVAVAHMDHPAFVALDSKDRRVDYQFRGFVNPEYFNDAPVDFHHQGQRHGGVVVEHDAETATGTVLLSRTAPVAPGDIGTWRLKRHRVAAGRFIAPACDDLAGVAAALAALDKTRAEPSLGHFSVLLTRAEEVGLVGAIHAATSRTLPEDARLLSVETSRELPDARIGNGPIIRVGDAVTVFDQEMSNRMSDGARAAGLVHQRKLMSGGGCEATAFGVFGYRASGLCLALGNWHNRGNLDAFESGGGPAVPMMEEISLDDFHGLVTLLGRAASFLDSDSETEARLRTSYEQARHLLS